MKESIKDSKMELKELALRIESVSGRNVKTVKITVPNEQVLQKLNSTPTFNRLSRLKLKVGENLENVNHAQFADMIRLYHLIGVKIEEI